MADPIPEYTIRYISGLGPTPGDPGVMRFFVYAVVEDGDGNRVSDPQQLTGAMTEQQTEHLWMQLGKVLGKRVAFGVDGLTAVIRGAIDSTPTDHIVTKAAADELVAHIMTALRKELGDG